MSLEVDWGCLCGRSIKDSSNIQSIGSDIYDDVIITKFEMWLWLVHWMTLRNLVCKSSMVTEKAYDN